jgi:hypothetical protein
VQPSLPPANHRPAEEIISRSSRVEAIHGGKGASTSSWRRAIEARPAFVIGVDRGVFGGMLSEDWVVHLQHRMVFFYAKATVSCCEDFFYKRNN